ncbi:MAG: (2Fe-2S)-binding protein [Chloroflexi bacterium]|nr:MAG: (2Fe-2S)-binding protein [Chloroflexota bacterium]
MPKITVEGVGTFDVPQGKRLVLALEDAGVDILHRCGGNARCTTCRVHFLAGEPQQMTLAERERLDANLLTGKARLSCQITCEDDMHIEVPYRVSQGAAEDAGPRPADAITPKPVWVEKTP